jgi:hypothetical protein
MQGAICKLSVFLSPYAKWIQEQSSISIFRNPGHRIVAEKVNGPEERKMSYDSNDDPAIDALLFALIRGAFFPQCAPATVRRFTKIMGKSTILPFMRIRPLSGATHPLVMGTERERRVRKTERGKIKKQRRSVLDRRALRSRHTPFHLLRTKWIQNVPDSCRCCVTCLGRNKTTDWSWTVT